MKLFFVGMAVVGFAAAPLGCDNPFDANQSVRLDVTQLDAPASIPVGSSLTVSVTMNTGGCVGFDHFEVERQGSLGGTLTVWGRDAAKGRKDIACTSDFRVETHSYTFDPPFQSPFTVQVDRGRLSPLIAVVQVQ